MNLYPLKPDQSYCLTPGLLWDGQARKPRPGLAVLISRGLIKRVAPVSTVLQEFDPETTVVDLPNHTLMPGLIDCHVHLAMDSRDLRQAVGRWENRPAEVERQVREALADYVAWGVLAVRDGGDKMNIGLRARHRITPESLHAPLVVATGQAIYRKSCYGDFLGPGAETLEEALLQIEERKMEKVDQLKVVNSGIVSFKNFGAVGAVQFSAPELARMADRARSLGLKVMVHASSAEAVETAVKAGVDSIEHGYFLTFKQMEGMAKKNIAWIPTLAPLGNLLAAGKVPYPGADLEVIRKTLAIQMTRVREAWEMGVRLGIGTDAGANNVPHGTSYRNELTFFEEAGLSRTTVLHLATAQSAEILGLAGRLGSIAPGKEPYLLALPKNPHKETAPLGKPEWVFRPASPHNLGLPS